MQQMLDRLKPDARSWRTVRSVGNSKPVQLTIFAPFVGYIIIYNEQISMYLMLSGLLGHDVNTDDAFFWRLFFLYIGLMLLGIGSIIYQIFCPRAVIKYPTTSEYISGEINCVTRLALDSMSLKVNKEKYNMYAGKNYGISDQIATRFGLSESETLSEFSQKIDYEEAKKELMRSYYKYSEKKSMILREICLFMFTLGAIFIFIPSLLLFVRIFDIACNRLFGWGF